MIVWLLLAQYTIILPKKTIHSQLRMRNNKYYHGYIVYQASMAYFLVLI